ncbi:dephospho-CoA kinase [Rhodoluna lacicola]|jgi:dephospho-CoA kinase|uniref:Dephospho-CoA kinase n=1 Tax=Rhodoluna lacicola TaxID=529884 RepID=A0A060JLX1_9MICO|nr:dephospho-CoA kinase [Rhodoluna lacicola]AIC47573.1 dephospho-CoA kinase [Rhodoluna lacicola]
MYLVGLTGGIASGKSTVASAWVELGGIEIDADQLAREVVEPGTPGLAAVKAAFGDSVISNGALDRSALGQLVFANTDKRKQLEAIVHPLVRELAAKKIAELPNDSIVIYNVPLLVEAAVDLDFDKVVTVEAPSEKQIERLVSIRKMNREEAERRVAAQASPAQRANAADVILNSNQDLHLLLKDARRLWQQIEHEAAQRGSN